MHITSDLYKDICAGEHWFENSLTVGDYTTPLGRPHEDETEIVTFGGMRIAIRPNRASTGITEDRLKSLSSELGYLPGSQPEIGICASRKLTAVFSGALGNETRAVKIRHWIRATDGTRFSEWIPKGTYYVDERSTSVSQGGKVMTTIVAYDAMLLTDRDYPPTGRKFPAIDRSVLRDICNACGIGIDPSVWEILVNGHYIPVPTNFTCREVLGQIAARYCGSFVINDDGLLQFLPLM